MLVAIVSIIIVLRDNVTRGQRHDRLDRGKNGAIRDAMSKNAFWRIFIEERVQSQRSGLSGRAGDSQL